MSAMTQEWNFKFLNICKAVTSTLRRNGGLSSQSMLCKYPGGEQNPRRNFITFPLLRRPGGLAIASFYERCQLVVRNMNKTTDASRVTMPDRGRIISGWWVHSDLSARTGSR
jgi:hypothetical protein